MHDNRGFTLIEALITAAIVASALVAVSTLFGFSIRANISNQQMAVATALLYDKMEELKWSSAVDGSDEVSFDAGVYRRVWQVSAAPTKSITVVVYVKSNALTRRETELIRATTLLSPTF